MKVDDSCRSLQLNLGPAAAHTYHPFTSSAGHNPGGANRILFVRAVADNLNVTCRQV